MVRRIANSKPVQGAATSRAEAAKAASDLVDRANASSAKLDEIPASPRHPAAFERIVERVFDLDILAAYEKLEGQLWIDDALTPQAVRSALNRCEENARVAHQLYVAAKLEHDLFEVEAIKVDGAMRRAAIDSCMAEKDTGIVKKQITEADVTARMAKLYPDEYVAVVSRRSKAENTIEHLKRLAELWQRRCWTLASLNNN